jgi:hypothetical protein
MPSGQNADAAPTDENAFFLVGTTRSGTTLLGLMFRGHSEISFPGEFDFAVDFMPGASPWPELESYYDWLSINRLYRFHHPKLDRSLDYPGLVRSFFAQMKVDSGGASRRIAGVAVHRHFDRLHRLFPKARFLHIVRDPRDVGVSWLEKGWAGNLWTASRTWQEIELLWDEVAGRIPADRRLEIRFEDLVAEPRSVLVRVCEFLGLAYEETMLDYPQRSTYEAVDPNQAYKWRGGLSKRELQLAEAPLADVLERRGYERSGHVALEIGALRARILELDDQWSQVRSRVALFGLRNWTLDQLAKVLRSKAWRRRLEIQRQDLVDKTLK